MGGLGVGVGDGKVAPHVVHLPLVASNQAKLDAVVEHLEGIIVDGARQYERALRIEAMQAEIEEIKLQ